LIMSLLEESFMIKNLAERGRTESQKGTKPLLKTWTDNKERRLPRPVGILFLLCLIL